MKWVKDPTFWQIVRAAATAKVVFSATLAVIFWFTGYQIAKIRSHGEIVEIQQAAEAERLLLQGQIAGLNELLEACRSKLTTSDAAMKASIAETEKARAAYAKVYAEKANRDSLCDSLTKLGYRCKGSR